MNKKVVVITGAASGIGLELCKHYLSQQYFVVGMDYNHKAVAQLEQRFPHVDWMVTDVCDKQQMLTAANRIIKAYNRVDIVIASAGVGGLNPGMNFSMEVHEKSIMINCLGLAYTLMPFISEVQKTQGSLVCISSMAAFRGLPNACSYSSSKGQQMLFMESLRGELSSHGIHTLCVHPGFVKTAMTNHTEFDMPFMVSAEKAALKIVKAISKRKNVLLFPWPMKIATNINRLMPNWLYDWLVPRLSGMKNPQARIF